MKTPVIDGILSAAKGFVDPALSQFGDDTPETNVIWDKMLNTLTPANLDKTIMTKIYEAAGELQSATWETGFTSGFRMGVRLMLECLGDTEEPQRGGTAHEYRD